ncbi:glycosyltransferase family 4 protein [Patescibacteria group bacterium]|nr:glycosyltransferase family 4 protein [Patescibacteria group bacterium]
MRVAINGSQLIEPLPAGPEIYALNIILGLGKTDFKNEYTIFLPKKPPQETLTKLQNLPPNFELKILPKVFSWTQISLALALIKRASIFRKKSNQFDVLFSPIHTLPFLALVLTSPKIKTISVIHGLEFLTNQQPLRLLQKMTKGLPERLTCMFSDQIVAPSDATRESILKMAQKNGWILKNKDIKVVPEGVADIFMKHKTYTEKSYQGKLAQYNIPNEPYLIFISTIQPRKNLKAIVEAISIVKNQYGKKINLVVCGKKGWNYQDDLNSPQKFGVKDQVFFVGRVPDEDLVILLKNAKAFISASLDEGFGLPVLEAMTVGTPLIISKIPAHKALAGEFAIYIDQNSTQDIAQKINLFLEEDKEVTKKKVEGAKRLAGNYSWEESARQISGLFHKISLDL